MFKFIKAVMAITLMGFAMLANPASAVTLEQRIFSITVSGDALNVVFQRQKDDTSATSHYTATWDALPGLTVSGESFPALVDDLIVKARQQGKVFEWSSIKGGMVLEGTVTGIRSGSLAGPGLHPASWVALAGRGNEEVFILEALFPEVDLVKPGDEVLVEVLPLEKNGAYFAISFTNLRQQTITQ